MRKVHHADRVFPLAAQQSLVLIFYISFLSIGWASAAPPMFPLFLHVGPHDLVSGHACLVDLQICCSALIVVFQVFLGAATWAGTRMQRLATRGHSSHRRRRRRRAAWPCCSAARRLCSARQALRASTTHSEYVAQLIAFVSLWRGHMFVVVSSLISVLGCAGAQGSEVPAERGGGLL
jgi:hypothetical protein